MADRVVEINAQEINQYVTCSMCAGYLKDAHVLTECMHTFCRACLESHFARYNSCPECKVEVDVKKRDHVKKDTVLQQLIDKIFPELHDSNNSNDKPAEQQAQNLAAQSAEITLRIIAQDPLQFASSAVHDTYLQTASHFQILHVKKYIARLSKTSVDSIAVYVSDEELASNQTLEFVYRTKWFDKSQDLILTFRKVML